MPASQLKGSRPVSLDEISKQAEDQLLTEFPEYKEKLATLLRNRFIPQTSAPTPVPESVVQLQVEKIELPQDELLSIIQKLHEVVQLPTAKLDQETELYLEQQLSDILGFEVSSTLDGHQLQFSKGMVDSLGHLPSNPQDRTVKPGMITEAPLQTQRSYYGWYGLNYSGETDSLVTPYS